MSNAPTLLVLAAGMGSRYGGLKQIDPVGPSGEIIIDYSIYDAIKAGFKKVVFLIRKDIEDAFREKVGNRYAGKIEIDYAFQGVHELPDGFTAPPEREKPWGTGHAVLMAENVIDSPFAVINADDFYGRSAFEKMAAFLEGETPDSTNMAMVGFILKNTLSDNGSVSRGVCFISPDGYLEKVVEGTKITKTENGIENLAEEDELKSLTGDEIVSMNMWGFTPVVFQELKKQFHEFLEQHLNTPKSEFYIPYAVDRMIKDGVATVKVLKSSDSWFGVTYREDKPVVIEGIRKLVDAGVYPDKLF